MTHIISHRSASTKSYFFHSLWESYMVHLCHQDAIHLSDAEPSSRVIIL